jgi:hypothetical protein
MLMSVLFKDTKWQGWCETQKIGKFQVFSWDGNCARSGFQGPCGDGNFGVEKQNNHGNTGIDQL